MPKNSQAKLKLTFHALVPERWADFETLFGARGACGGCWCMTWRLKRSLFDAQKGEANRLAMKKLVDAGEVPGILAYDKDKPIGWIAVAPREVYVSLERSRVLKPIDDVPVWSVSCFFIAKGYRKKGVSAQLLKAAAKFVGERGGRMVEGYPVEPSMNNMPDVFAWTGLPGSFVAAGFTEVARRSPSRPIMRLRIRSRKSK